MIADIGIRVLGVVLLLWLLVSGDVTGIGLWVCLAGLAIAALLLAAKVAVCVIALRDPDGGRSQESPPV